MISGPPQLWLRLGDQPFKDKYTGPEGRGKGPGCEHDHEHNSRREGLMPGAFLPGVSIQQRRMWVVNRPFALGTTG